MELSLLSPEGSRKKRKRIGRGNGSGLGKTSGKGHKGQNARSGGGVRPGFEGGQMPIYKRIPKFGFRSPQQIAREAKYSLVNVNDLARFDEGAVVDPELLAQAGLGVSSGTNGKVKLLGTGECSKKLTIKVHACSSGAKAKVEAAGGTIELIGSE